MTNLLILLVPGAGFEPAHPFGTQDFKSYTLFLGGLWIYWKTPWTRWFKAIFTLCRFNQGLPMRGCSVSQVSAKTERALWG